MISEVRGNTEVSVSEDFAPPCLLFDTQRLIVFLGIETMDTDMELHSSGVNPLKTFLLGPCIPRRKFF